jgi:hypothetical protein
MLRTRRRSHSVLGFRSLPLSFLGILVATIVTYLAPVELGKARFFHVRRRGQVADIPHGRRGDVRRQVQRAR